MLGENTLDQIQLQILKEQQAREAGLSPYRDLHEAKSEKEIARKMKEKGYEYIILVPGKDALYAKSVKMAAELARTDLKDYKVGIQKIDDFLAGKKLKGYKETVGPEFGEDDDDLVSEAKMVKGEDLYAALRKIVDEKTAAKINGILVDLFSASTMVQVLDRLNAQNRKKLLSMGLPAMHDIVFTIVGKKQREDADFDEFVTEAGAGKIRVVHPGISKVPEGGWEKWGVSKLVAHFKKLGQSIGKPEAMRAILNIERWNKNQNPELSAKARKVIDALKKDKDWSGEDIDIDQEALAELNAISEASEVGHYYLHGGNVYGDSAFLRVVGYNIEKILPGFEMKHMGFGEFYLDGGSKGRVDFARTSPSAKLGIGGDRTELPQQVGRLYRVYDDKGGKLVKEILKKAKNIKQVKLAIKDDVVLGMMDDDELREFVVIGSGLDWDVLEKKAGQIDRFMKQFMGMVKRHEGGRKMSTILNYIQNAIGDFRVNFKEDVDDLDEAIDYEQEKQLGMSEEKGSFLDDAEDIVSQLKSVMAKIGK